MERTLPALTTIDRLLVHRILAGAFIAFGLVMVTQHGLATAVVGFGRDAIGYYDAGVHIRTDQPLYFDDGAPFGSEVFLFAPWFAWAWVPLSFLPRDLVLAGWVLGMCAATVWAVAPFFRLGLAGIALGSLLGYTLSQGAFWGNVMPLLVGVLIHSHGRRSFPVWVGLAASLKILPILYVWPDLAARRWRRVAVAIGIAAALWAPALLYGLSDYPTGFTPTMSLLWLSGWVWAGVAALAVIAMIAASRTRYRWLATTLAILALYPRLHFHYIGLLGVGLRRNPHDEERCEARLHDVGAVR